MFGAMLDYLISGHGGYEVMQEIKIITQGFKDESFASIAPIMPDSLLLLIPIIL
jgi:hypothetical protein